MRGESTDRIVGGRGRDRPSGPVERPRGRPRVQSNDGAILDAALDLLRSAGYAKMTIEQVAIDAGVSRPTVYRRWRTKVSLAVEAINRLHSQDPPIKTGNPRDDVVAELNDMRRTFDRVHGLPMLGTLLAERERHPELLAAWSDRLARPRRRRIQTILENAKITGHVGEDADTLAASWMLIGSYYNIQTVGDEMPDNWAERVVAVVLRGLAPAEGVEVGAVANHHSS